MMVWANVLKEVQFMVYRADFDTACKLDGLIPITIDGTTKPRYEHWVGKDPDFANHLQTWGEVGTVTCIQETSTKLQDRGRQCMFVVMKTIILETATECGILQ